MGYQYTAPPSECIAFRTIREALEECASTSNTRGFHGEQRYAYVIAKLRAAKHPDCDKAVHFMQQIFNPL